METELMLLKDARLELLQEIDGLSDAQLNEEIEKDGWTIMQVLHHLVLMEENVTKIIRSTIASEETQFLEAKPVHYTVNRSIKVDAPSFVYPREQSITFEEIKNKLQNSRRKLLLVLSQTNRSLLEARGSVHPVFGLIRLDQWVSFIGYHEKRHLEQIQELKDKQ
ncbi:DinB family protein [Bacillus sp. 2205SS5-2]|uniref:DinB family protein n=1 Tax=Bacillus sp. 2205SS5-2 TaxID=3109031 RepID=UPI00300577AE